MSILSIIFEIEIKIRKSVDEHLKIVSDPNQQYYGGQGGYPQPGFAPGYGPQGPQQPVYPGGENNFENQYIFNIYIIKLEIA